MYETLSETIMSNGKQMREIPERKENASYGDGGKIYDYQQNDSESTYNTETVLLANVPFSKDEHTGRL